MSFDSLVFWLFVVAWIVVGGAILFVALPRIYRELRHGVIHVVRMVNDSPLPLQLAKAEADAARIETALDRLPLLLARARTARDTIRTTPLVPPNVTAFVTRVQAEIAAFRRSARS